MKINEYVCESCDYHTVTLEKIKGVTPAFLKCRNPDRECYGMATSAWYDCDQQLVPTWEWYKPEGEELEQLRIDSLQAVGHVESGGLLLKRINDE